MYAIKLGLEVFTDTHDSDYLRADKAHVRVMLV